MHIILILNNSTHHSLYSVLFVFLTYLSQPAEVKKIQWDVRVPHQSLYLCQRDCMLLQRKALSECSPRAVTLSPPIAAPLGISEEAECRSERVYCS